jgi:uncharacterized protein YihD (DUF1040 family)
MLFLFIIYSVGTAGILVPKHHKLIRDIRTRNISANLLLSGAGIYFILSALFVVVCCVMLIPGGAVRSLVCKPLTQLEGDSMFQYFKNVDFLGYYSDTFKRGKMNNKINAPIYHINKLNVKQLIKDCRDSGNSAEIANLNDLWIPAYWNPKNQVGSKFMNDSLKQFASSSFAKFSEVAPTDQKQLEQILEDYADSLMFNGESIKSLKDALALLLESNKDSNQLQRLNELADDVLAHLTQMEQLKKPVIAIKEYKSYENDFKNLLDSHLAKESLELLNTKFNHVKI